MPRPGVRHQHVDVVDPHRRVLTLVTLGAYSDPPIGAIKVAMKQLGVPISPTVRGPALPATDEEGVESVLEALGLTPGMPDVPLATDDAIAAGSSDQRLGR
jgi:dihydrodipicolinate synthase/N-acetylneuraminate lyase